MPATHRVSNVGRRAIQRKALNIAQALGVTVAELHLRAEEAAGVWVQPGRKSKSEQAVNLTVSKVRCTLTRKPGTRQQVYCLTFATTTGLKYGFRLSYVSSSPAAVPSLALAVLPSSCGFGYRIRLLKAQT